MADKKITALTDLGDSLASADLFHVVDDPAGTPINKKISAENVFNNIPSWLGLAQASQAITADASSQVANVTSAVTEVNATSSTGAISLADGADGQIKTFMMAADGGDMVITVTNAGWKSSGTGTITFANIGEACTLMYINSKWFCTGNNGATFA